jgi:hypothetical protein
MYETALITLVGVVGAAAGPLTALSSAEGAVSQEDEVTLTPQPFHGGVSILMSKFVGSAY